MSSVGVLDSSGNRVDPMTDDPIMTLAETMAIGVTYAKRTTPVFRLLVGRLVGNAGGTRYMTFEVPSGTDYSVPASKVLNILKVWHVSDGANRSLILGYADDGVADGLVAPTTPIYLTGIAGAVASAMFFKETANKTFKELVHISIPAGKFPFLSSGASTAVEYAEVFGVEVDV